MASAAMAEPAAATTAAAARVMAAAAAGARAEAQAAGARAEAQVAAARRGRQGGGERRRGKAREGGACDARGSSCSRAARASGAITTCDRLAYKQTPNKSKAPVFSRIYISHVHVDVDPIKLPNPVCLPMFHFQSQIHNKITLRYVKIRQDTLRYIRAISTT